MLKSSSLKICLPKRFSTKSKMKDYNSLKMRYKIMIPDFLLFCSDRKIRLALGWIKVIGWGFKEGIRYRRLGFLPWCIGEGLKVKLK